MHTGMAPIKQQPESTAEDAAAAALRGSLAVNRMQVHLAEESRVLLAALIRDEMRIAVAEGIAAAMSQFFLPKLDKDGNG